MSPPRCPRSTSLAIVLILLLGSLRASSAEAQTRGAGDRQVYLVANVRDVITRSAIAATGAVIVEGGHDYVLVETDARTAAGAGRKVENQLAGLRVQPQDAVLD